MRRLTAVQWIMIVVGSVAVTALIPYVAYLYLAIAFDSGRVTSVLPIAGLLLTIRAAIRWPARVAERRRILPGNPHHRLLGILVAIPGGLFAFSVITVSLVLLGHDVWGDPWISDAIPLTMALAFSVMATVFSVRFGSTCAALARWSPVAQPYLACQACQYNLTGNESGVCPECGQEIEREAVIRSDD